MSEIAIPPKLLHGSVLALFAGAVYLAGNFAVGGYESFGESIQELTHSSFGLESIDVTDTKLEAETSAVATATSSCMDPEAFSTDQVHRLGKGPYMYQVYVRKIGAGALNKVSVEQCIALQTGLHASVIQENS
jgi:hypothetical protein